MSIEVKDIQFSYDDFDLRADLDIKKGEFLSILGPSGCGKTTLLRIIAGFNKPAKGRIIMNGNRDITALNTAERNIGMVFQDYALFPHLNVYRNISYGLEIRRKTPADVSRRIRSLLKLMNLEGYEKRSINELSGGEKQRIALARALAPEPELLLFDEPLSALDVKLRKNLRREIRRIQQELGFTAVYVTHDQEEAMSISDRIAVMNAGRICQLGTPEQLYTQPVDFFTADFIGTMNRISAPDGEVVMFRPEDCILSTDDENEEGALLIEAAVISSEYRGGYYNCEAETTASEIFSFYSEKRLYSGKNLRFSVRAVSLP